VHMERIIRQNAAARAWAVAIDNNCRCLSRKTDHVIRIGLELENYSAGDIGRSIIDWHDRDLRAAFTGWNSDRTGQRDIIDSVGCRTANGIINCNGIIGGAKTMNGERCIFRSAVCGETKAGYWRNPIAPSAE